MTSPDLSPVRIRLLTWAFVAVALSAFILVAR
jgi:hypothetical protein